MDHRDGYPSQSRRRCRVCESRGIWIHFKKRPFERLDRNDQDRRNGSKRGSADLDPFTLHTDYRVRPRQRQRHTRQLNPVYASRM